MLEGHHEPVGGGFDTQFRVVLFDAFSETVWLVREMPVGESPRKRAHEYLPLT